MNDTSGHGESSDVSRRDVLELLSVATVSGVAGCGGDSGGASTPTDTPPETTTTGGAVRTDTATPDDSSTPTPGDTSTPTDTENPTDTATETRTPTLEEDRKIVFLTGGRSHGFMEHSFRAGTALLADRLENNAENVTTHVAEKWPDDPDMVFEDVDAVVMYFDGGTGHPVNDHEAVLQDLAEQGEIGLVPIHYACQVPSERGHVMLEGVGGYYETYYSVNPFWTPEFDELPTHPVTSGIDPFTIHDEWYYHLQFTDGMENVTPILTDLPPDESITDRWSPDQDDHISNGNQAVYEAVVENDEPQHVAWAYEGDAGNRGFGFTGAHYHRNWGHDGFRDLVLNGIAWAARMTLPPGGITSETPTVDELLSNLDYEQPDDFDREELANKLDAWNDT
jgi:hypothetical protein